jgi:hypothetical protein
MTRNHMIRCRQALVPAAIVAALALPAVALAGSHAGYGAHDGWYSYATSVTPAHGTAAGDSNRYGARDGWYTQAVSLTRAVTSLPLDGRSPDTLDAAQASQPQVADGRSPDTRDAAQAVQPIELVTPGGFDWRDAGIGAAMTAMITLLAGSILLLTRKRNRVQTT